MLYRDSKNSSLGEFDMIIVSFPSDNMYCSATRNKAVVLFLQVGIKITLGRWEGK